jgi:hypothetical protein
MSLPYEGSTKAFKGRHFNHEIITLCIRWYVTYKLIASFSWVQYGNHNGQTTAVHHEP